MLYIRDCQSKSSSPLSHRIRENRKMVPTKEIENFLFPFRNVSNQKTAIVWSITVPLGSNGRLILPFRHVFYTSNPSVFGSIVTSFTLMLHVFALASVPISVQLWWMDCFYHMCDTFELHCDNLHTHSHANICATRSSIFFACHNFDNFKWNFLQCMK